MEVYASQLPCAIVSVRMPNLNWSTRIFLSHVALSVLRHNEDLMRNR